MRLFYRELVSQEILMQESPDTQCHYVRHVEIMVDDVG